MVIDLDRVAAPDLPSRRLEPRHGCLHIVLVVTVVCGLAIGGYFLFALWFAGATGKAMSHDGPGP